MDDDGDDEFEDWYREHYRRVFASVLFLTRDRSATAEAVDEAFARALERWGRVRRMESPAGWTFVVARNLVRRSGRRAARDRTLVVRDEPQLPDLTVELWDLVAALPKRAQELVALRYVAGLGEREIADALGIAPGTVARGLHDARGRLHELLAPDTAEDRT